MLRWIRSAVAVSAMVAALSLAHVAALAAAPQAGEEAAEKARDAKIVGPEQAENNCATCHKLEDEAWQHTHHYSTFVNRHRTPRAREILKNMGLRTMKRVAVCRRCHYTSVLVGDNIRPEWGVSCESCHGPAKEWVNIHSRPGGNPSAPALKWGAGKTETPAARRARLSAAEAKGMIGPEMLYDIAANCYGCHTVPDEELVNKGGHHAGSDFNLVAWSQGEVRHNFVSSAGAPDRPTNRPATAPERRRLYVVGAMVDLEFSLRNLASVKDKGGAFQKAMIDRVNHGRAKVDAILKAASLPGLAAAVHALPATVGPGTAIPAGAPDALRKATRQFVASNDGSGLGALDALIPKDTKGTAFQP